MFENVGKKQKKKNHKDVAVAKKPTNKPLKPFKEGADNFVRSTISIPNDFGRFLHEEILHGGIKKKKLTEIIMGLLEEEYGKKFMEWRDKSE